MFVSYKFWAVLQDCYRGGSVASGTNYCLTMDRQAALKIYNELKKEFG